MERLALRSLKMEAKNFLRRLGRRLLPKLYGVTDGKAVGTYVEHGFHAYLEGRYTYTRGSSASGIDFPKLRVDMKVTSFKQPQSSCPYRNADQKVYGLGYHLLVFVYDKKDDQRKHSARLRFQHAIFIARNLTGDYQTTFGLREILRRNGNKDDVVSFLIERNLPLDEPGREELARRILRKPPKIGFLTISNALQWRLQYGRSIDLAADGETKGVENLLG